MADIGGMRLPDWITWPRMHWRLRVILRWYAVAQLLALATVPWHPELADVPWWGVAIITVAFPACTLLLPVLGTTMIQEPLPFIDLRRRPDEALMRGALVTVGTLAFVALKLLFVVALAAVIYYAATSI